MRTKRSFYLGRLFLAFIITTVIFASIFVLADVISYLNYKDTASQNRFIQTVLDDFAQRGENITCDDVSLSSSLEQLDHVGSYISLLEKRFGIHDSRVISEKKLYNQLQIRHMRLIRELTLRCKSQFDIILFFYSNDGSLIDASEFMGSLLGAFKTQDPSRFMIYSFDTSLGDAAVDSLADQYFIERVPVVVVHDNRLLYPGNINDLSTALA